MILPSLHVSAAEMTMDEIKKDFKAAINHFNYETGPEVVKTGRVRERIVESTESEEILNLEDDFSDSVSTKNAAPIKSRRQRSR